MIHCAIEGYTHSLGDTPLNYSPVFSGLISTVARGFTWKQRWDARLASSFAVSCLGELQEGGGLARAWTTRGLKVLSTNAPMKRRGRRGDSWHGTAILLRFAVAPHENRSKFI